MHPHRREAASFTFREGPTRVIDFMGNYDGWFC